MIELNHPHLGVRLFPDYANHTKSRRHNVEQLAYNFRFRHPNAESNHVGVSAPVADVETDEETKVVIDVYPSWDEMDFPPAAPPMSNLQGIPLTGIEPQEGQKSQRQRTAASP
jgi:hypothetical protein